MNTRARILDVARRRFNARGVAQTTNLEIAAAVGIAVGNLWYHFRTREALVAALAQAAAADFRQALALAEGPAPVLQRYVRYTHGTVQVMWTHRFLASDPLLRGPGPLANDLPATQHAKLRALLGEFDEQAYFKAPGPDLDALASSIWMVVRYWPDHLRDFEQVAAPTVTHWRRGFGLQMELLRLSMAPAAFAELQAWAEDTLTVAADRGDT